MGQLLQGDGPPPAAVAAHPQYAHDAELPEQIGSTPGGTPRSGSPTNSGQFAQSQPGAGASTANSIATDGVEDLAGKQPHRSSVVSGEGGPGPQRRHQAS